MTFLPSSYVSVFQFFAESCRIFGCFYAHFLLDQYIYIYSDGSTPSWPCFEVPRLYAQPASTSQSPSSNHHEPSSIFIISMGCLKVGDASNFFNVLVKFIIHVPKKAIHLTFFPQKMPIISKHTISHAKPLQ